MMTTRTAPVVLSQTAPWNARLTNPYRTRYAEVAGRYFRVQAETLNGLWWVEEVDADGVPLPTSFLRSAWTLYAARAIITEALA